MHNLNYSRHLLLISSLSIIVSALLTSNIVYGQLTPNIHTSNSSGTSGPKLPGVKITSPTKGQKVPVGALSISGESTDNAASDCTVSVKLNGIKPYQPSAPTGPKGATDYSTWKFTLTPKYAVIKEGANKITSKITCHDISANLTKFYSVNVTGITNTQTAGNGSALLAGPVPSNRTQSINIDSPASASPLSSSSYKGDSNANNNDNEHHSSHSNDNKHHHGSSKDSRSDNHKQHHHGDSMDSSGSSSDNDEEEE
jgi:hypothetical protein